MTVLRFSPTLVVTAAFGFAGCSGDQTGNTGGAGQSASGGSVPVASGGSTSTQSGGASAVTGGGANLSGAANTGGTQSVGGSPSSGGVAGSTTNAGGSSSGGTLTNGGASGGLPSNAGTTSTGGTGASGANTGGATNGGTAGTTSGGAGGTSSKGGTSSTGGTSTGGTSTGGTSTGGTSTGGTSTGGTSTGGTSGTCVPATCGTHKWACWRMPNPAGTGLPNLASYTTTNGVVHDNVTCLDWEQSPPSTTSSNAAAITRCDGLTLGGYSDWRAPTRIEMTSIVDYTRSPTTDAAFTAASGFHKTGSNWVLTIDQRGAGAGTDYAWSFNLGDGIVSNARSAATADRVRCVRGNGAGEGFSDKAVAPPNQYTSISADETSDNYTGLVWQRDGNASGLLSWDAAVTYCTNLTLGGHDNWRLPSVRELATLVDETLVAPSINRTQFPNTHYGSRSNNWYWASHRARGSTTASWGLNFDDGFTGFNAGASGAWNYWTAGYAKCVR